MIVQSIPAKANAAEKVDDFEEWLGQRHKWLQTAAHQIIERKSVASGPELIELTQLCLGEASGTGTHAFAKLVPGSLIHGAGRPTLHIEKLSAVRGVNKIRDDASLNFGTKNLAVVYGANGSGKTGFSRLLKQICGSRAREEIYPNVFNKAVTACEAKISVSIGGAPSELGWTVNGGSLQPLRDVHVFDARTASNYLAQQNEAMYEPSRMRFVSALIKTSDGVAAQLLARKNALITKLPLFPPALAQATNAKWLSSLQPTTSQADIDNACDYPNELDVERVAAEGALAQKDIAGRLGASSRELVSLVQTRASLTALQDGFSDLQLGTLITARTEAVAKRKTASEAAEAVFATAPLEGVGQKTWLALWEHAKAFSQLHAYPGHTFPNTDAGAHCVLCQQTLTDGAKTRFGHFEAFVTGGLEDAAKAAEKTHADLLKKLPTIPQEHDWALQTSSLKLDEVVASEIYAELGKRRSAAMVANQVNELPTINWTAVDKAHTDVSEALTAEMKALRELQGDVKRKQLEARVLELLTIQWLSQNKAAICEEAQRLKDIALIEKAIGLTNTNVLTRKHTELAKDDLYKGYQSRFETELKLLGGNRLPVKPERNKPAKGR